MAACLLAALPACADSYGAKGSTSVQPLALDSREEVTGSSQTITEVLPCGIASENYSLASSSRYTLLNFKGASRPQAASGWHLGLGLGANSGSDSRFTDDYRLPQMDGLPTRTSLRLVWNWLSKDSSKVTPTLFSEADVAVRGRGNRSGASVSFSMRF